MILQRLLRLFASLAIILTLVILAIVAMVDRPSEMAMMSPEHVITTEEGEDPGC